VLNIYRNQTGKYWNEDDGGGGGNGLRILAPTPEIVADCNSRKDWNNISYVLRYRTENCSIILGGDAENSTWENIVEHHGEKYLKCDVLKASHHGRDTGYHQKAVKAMSPKYTIVSVGKKPSQDATNKYRQYSENVWSTRWRGNISLNIDSNGMHWDFSERGDSLSQWLFS
jgi:beta-lactamase superfamily II metal-dependent hydrolase